MRQPLAGRRAFTLVEIVLALAVLAFCLVSLFGLFSVGLSNSRKSDENTAIAGMSSQVFGVLRAQNTNAAGQTVSFYFDADGQMTNASAYYTCDTTFSHASTKGLTNTYDAPLLIAQLRFRWPAQVNPAPNTNIINLTLPPAGS